MKINPYILSFYILISIIVVVMPTIPHHHHSDGAICMKDDIQTDDCCSHHTPHHHPYDDPCCTGDCVTQTINAESVSQQVSLTQPYDLPTITLFTELLFRLIHPPLNNPDYGDYVYRESLHSTYITCAAGLRGPPSRI